MNIMKITLIVLVFGMIQATAFAEPNRGINFVSEVHVSGDYQDVKIVGDRIYCANNYGVVVWTFDERSPEIPPIEIGRFPTPGQAHSLFIDDTLCYVADGSSGLRIYNVANLEAVEELGSYDETTGFTGITVHNSIAFLIRDRVGIYSIDVADPTNISLLCFYEFNVRDTRRMIINGDYLWTTQMNTYFLTALDISNPREIRISGQFEGSRCGPMFGINRDLAYVSSSPMRVINIADVNDIQEITTFNHANFVGAVYNNGYLYGDQGTYFSITDVRNLNFISLPGYLCTPSLTSSGMMDFRGHFVYSPARTRGLKIINVSDPRHPNLQHVNGTNGIFKSVAYRDNYLYVPDSQTGIWPVEAEHGYESVGRLRVYSVADPFQPVQVAEVDSLVNRGNLTTLGCMFLRDSLAYIGGQALSLNIFNIRNPERPVQLLGGGPNDDRTGTNENMTMYEDYLFYAGGMARMQISSVADPLHPELITILRPDDNTRLQKIFVDDDYLIVTAMVNAQFNGVVTYDWSDPHNLRRVGSWGQLSGYRADGVRQGDYLYLVGGYIGASGMSVVNIEDPLNPREVYATNDVQSGSKAIIARNHLIIGDFNYGVRIFDLSNPERPEQVGFYDTPDRPSGVAVDEERGFLFVADYSDVSVYDIGELFGVWDLTVTTEALDFGEIGLGAIALDTVGIENHAAELIIIDSVRVMGAGFSNDQADGMQLTPDEAEDILVYFQSDTSGNYHGCLSIYSAGRVRDVVLNAIIRQSGVSAGNHLPLDYELHPAFPNPFNSTTTIGYSLPVAGIVSLAVYDLTGREVARLVDGVKPAGTHEAIWVADGIASGVYVVALNTSGMILREKVVLVK